MSDFSERDPLIFSTSNGPSGLRTEQHDSKWLNGNVLILSNVTILHLHLRYLKNSIENWKRKKNKFYISTYSFYFFPPKNVIFSTVKLIFLRFPYLFSKSTHFRLQTDVFFGIRWLGDFVKNYYPINKLCIQNGQPALLQGVCLCRKALRFLVIFVWHYLTSYKGKLGLFWYCIYDFLKKYQISSKIIWYLLVKKKVFKFFIYSVFAPSHSPKTVNLHTEKVEDFIYG